MEVRCWYTIKRNKCFFPFPSLLTPHAPTHPPTLAGHAPLLNMYISFPGTKGKADLSVTH